LILLDFVPHAWENLVVGVIIIVLFIKKVGIMGKILHLMPHTITKCGVTVIWHVEAED